jgi:hypothetical protein
MLQSDDSKVPDFVKLDQRTSRLGESLERGLGEVAKSFGKSFKKSINMKYFLM